MGRSVRRARRHPRWTVAAAVLVLVAAGSGLADAQLDEPERAVASTERRADPRTPRAPAPEPAIGAPSAADGVAGQAGGTSTSTDGPARRRAAATNPARQKAVQPAEQRYRVARVVDGDTVEMGDGRTVRLVGIDTPERGECGFDAASAALARLVEGERVRLTRPADDRDRYGRLLRYLDLGAVDPGLRLIRTGRAIARYDSRDGYGSHPREDRYIAADRTSRQRGCRGTGARAAAPPRSTTRGTGCDRGYRPCIAPYPPDLDCGDLAGPVSVRGSDPHGLDADGDGTACE